MVVFILLLIFLILVGWNFGNKRLTLYIFIALFPVLPDYFAINLGILDLTASRVLIMFLFIFYLFHRNKTIRVLSLFSINAFTSSFLFIVLIVCINILHIKTASTSLNMIIQILIEQLLVMIMISSLIKDRNELINLFKTISITSGVLSIMGIIEAITGYNVAYLLKTVDSLALQTSYERLGFLRSEVSFGHPVYFGFYCILTLILSLYLFDSTKKKFYHIIGLLNLVALFLSGSRGSIFSLLLILILFILIRPQTFISYFKYIPIAFLLVFFWSILMPSVLEYMTLLLKSTMNVFGANYQIDNFGTNSRGADSRIAQLSLFEYLINKGDLFFGLGAKAQVRELLFYKYDGGWQNSNTYDIGYLAYLGNYGIAGLIGFILFNFNLIYKSVVLYMSEKQNKLLFFFIVYFISYMISLLSATGLDRFNWIIISLFIAYQRVREMEIIE